ncbi:MAG TPA: hypothetical protein VGX25_08400 [Actinophytocola sp.]|uniref:hypothetical protein n=1 Tax=Actinophytocola sp. TaxID=1872138 RepID=UPI002DDD21B5|nr:hypothetical protein [Actinophytocola sp.]HEV2779409.1 hypothetical protein [Actinophytocola sp.]
MAARSSPASALVFGLTGLVFATWAARIPVIQRSAPPAGILATALGARFVSGR